jgi:UDP-N-acetylmuramoyl-tripeptide--D-alanyl-D-alanine ligase
MIWTGKQLSEAFNIKVDEGLKTGPVQFNSVDVKPCDLFIALERGHQYVEDAFKNGAEAAIVSNPSVHGNIIHVPDTMQALRQLAEYKRKTSKAKFIAITGSAGKTSTKEAMKNMLEPFGKVFASRGNFNNYLGVPINLASMPDDTEYAVFELGMNHSGEISELTKMIKPDIAIITNVAEAHLEFFDSVTDIADAKCEIFEGLSKNGIAIINRDSLTYDRMMFNLNRLSIKNIYSFGTGADSELILYQAGTKLKYKIGSTEVDVEGKDFNIPKHHAQNFAALGFDLNLAAKAIAKYSLGEGRGKIINVTKDSKKFTIIGDYYNANPPSLKASLEYLQQLNHPKKMAIIGDMQELGPSAADLHKSLVPFITNSGASKVLLVGSYVNHIKMLMPKNIFTSSFENVESLLMNLGQFLDGDELILIKGSRGMQLDRILEYFDKR